MNECVRVQFWGCNKPYPLLSQPLLLSRSAMVPECTPVLFSWAPVELLFCCVAHFLGQAGS